MERREVNSRTGSSPSRTPRLCLAVTSLVGGSGGIARVACLMAKVLAHEVGRGRLAARAIGLLDPAARPDLGIPFSPGRGSRVRFIGTVNLAAVRSTHFLYDSLAMARAHDRLPLLHRPSLVWIHGVEVWERARPSRLAAARRADILVANTGYSRTRADALHGGFARARICWLGTESDEPGAGCDRKNGPPIVMILGRLEPGRDKGHRALIACWPEAVPDARLIVVGTGADLEPVRRCASGSRAARSIEFRGFVPDADIEELWARTTVFAMPSRSEGFGLTYIEAMRHGVPVIASVHDAAPEINIDGQTGYNVDLDRNGELARRLIGLLADRDLAARLGDAGRSRWAEHFCFSAFRTRFLPLLGELLARD